MFDKESAQIKIKELVESFSSAYKNKDYINEQNEAWVKHHYIEVLLETLGWKRGDIEMEVRILKGRADYILKIGNEEVAVIEAKKVGVTLSEDEGRQAVSYAYHRKIKFAILTNFKEIRVYHALNNIKNIDHNLLKFEGGEVFRLDFEHFLGKIEWLSLLSKESFENKELSKLLPTKIEKASKPIDESILEDLLYIRELLSKDLKKVRISLEKEQIDEIVQMLIDRLIFMRSVEDRGLEDRDFLRKMVMNYQEMRSEKRLWTALKEKFKVFDKTYNSKLFAEGLLEQEGAFDDETLVKVIKTLYFGRDGIQERYMFDEIPGDLLGSIYEQYLGTILQGTEKRVKLEEGSAKRKKMGIYYTPSYIVDYIVKNTVGEYIKNKSIDEILKVKIVDPACGSGSFIVRAFKEVCNAIEDRLKEGKTGKDTQFSYFKDKLDLGQKSAILERCIYGVDLDEKAIELAQLNLLLEILNEETVETRKRILPNLKNNIKCGNSLIDDSSVSDRAFKWEAQFKEVFDNGGFDVVVGNPPYGAELPEKDRKYLENRFELGNTDTACLFMKFATNIIKKNGVNGLIVPKPFVYSSTWSTIRESLLESLIELVDCGKVWKEVKLEQVIYIYKKELSEKIYNSCVRKGSQIVSIGKIDKSTFNEFGFLLNGISKRELELGRKIKNAGESLNEFITNQRGAIYQKEVSNKKEELKVLGGAQIGKYLVYPNEIKGYIKENVVKDEKARIKENSILVQRLVAHIEHPIDHIKITASLSNGLKVKDFIIVDTINQLSNKGKISSEYLLAIINSRLTNWYAYRFIFGKAIRTMQFDNPVSERIIIAKPSKAQESIIISFVDKMLELQKKYHAGSITGGEKERLEQQIKNIDYEIDEEVYKLYGITKEEQKIIEESLK
ncbi:MAG: N-6 DNA methylase [Nanoarchaeota archaeon]